MIAEPTLEEHEFANLTPRMTDEQYTQLVEDIGEHGLLQPIVLYDGKLLDGRHRYRACTELMERGHSPNIRFESFEGTRREAYAYVLSMNLHRRHLEYSQRAALAALWKRAIQAAGEVKHGGDRRSKEFQDCEIADLKQETAEVAASKFQVGQRSVYEAEKIADKAPDLFEQMVDGGMGLREAQREIRDRERRERAERLREAGAMPTGKFRVIYADPPWSYGNTMPDYFTEQADHYPLMSLSEICALPVAELAEDDAVLFLWVTSPILEDAFKVIHAWGFEYKSSFVWHKMKHNMGHYNSVRHEFLLVCTRGSCQPDVQRLFPSVVDEERTEHSAKPESFRQIIDTIYPHGRRVELFARKQVEGWESYGNELSRL